MSEVTSEEALKITNLTNRIAELEKQLDEMRMHTHVLLDIARSLNASLDIHTIAQNIISAIASSIAIDKATVCLCEDRADTFTVIGIFDSGTIYPALPPHFDFSFLHSVLNKGQTYYRQPCPNDKEWDWLCVLPLKTSQRKIGTINIHAIRQGEITRDQLEFLETIAGQASSALENALLYALVERESITDSLTGIYNHRYFQKRLREEIFLCQRGKRHTALGLLMIDVDYFKSFNDTYGHQFGDKVLVKVVQALIRNLREEDILARYGGEEFVLLIPQASEKMLVTVSEKVRKVVENTELYHIGSEQHVHITVSIGVTLWHPADTPESMIQRADNALYQAKGKGRNQIIFV